MPLLVAVNHKLDAALAYAEAGIAVFPCYTAIEGRCSCGGAGDDHPIGKHPRTRAGHLDATTDPEQIRRWWNTWPDANIGAAMKASGLIAADVDPRHGGDESWRDLEQSSDEAISETWTNLTGGGGEHLIYRVPPGFDTHTDTIAEGVDIKWAGYIILPPSDHRDQRAYTWESGYSPFDREPALLPPSLRTRIQSRNGTQPAAERAPIADLLARDVSKGERNTTLASIAGHLRNEVDQSVTLAICESWNALHCKPPLDSVELARTIGGMYLRYKKPAKAIFGSLEGSQATAAPGARPRYEIIDGPDYLDLPAPRWLVQTFLPDRSFAAIVGQPGSYKSFLALELGLCIATGHPFFGRAVECGAVLYVLAEGANGFSLRMQAWQRRRGIPIPRTFKVLRGSVPLTDHAAVAELIQQVAAYGIPFRLVVIDTLSRSMPGADENAPKDMTAAVAAADLIQRLLECTVLILHHGTKADGTTRGHSSLTGALDTVVKCTADKERGIVTVMSEKAKDAADFPMLLLQREVVELGRPDVDPETGEIAEGFIVMQSHSSVVLEPLNGYQAQAERHERIARRLTPYQRAAARVLVARAGTSGLTHEEWWQGCKEMNRWNSGQRQRYQDARKALIEKELVQAPEVGGVTRYMPSATLPAILAATSETSEIEDLRQNLTLSDVSGRTSESQNPLKGVSDTF